ncbi:NADP-dependent oxidoreductase [Streptomyces sp. NPDC097619]|uniref:NADP-dependent oxidoreductase n=1 Tax=Streptomyces sp. NPDC097619 TaxID=3157228 RepID=UPI0033240983
MKAVVQEEFGGPEVLKLADVPRPVPGIAEVLVRVHATAINPTDSWHRASGGITGLFGGEPRIIPLGWDLSGVVEEVGPGVTLFQPGDEVFGMPGHPGPGRTYAEYALSPARHLARKPAGLTHVEAAALPLAGLTAWQALVDTADVRPGQRVLVHAAAGGVGHLAVQIAKARGAYVIGTAGAGKHELLRELGADELVDYRETDFAEAVRDVDVVLDLIGGEYGPRSLRTLRPGGRIVSLAGPHEAALAPEAEARGFVAGFMGVESDGQAMRELAAMAADGRLRPHVDAVFPLADAAGAHALLDTKRTTGKIVLTAV